MTADAQAALTHTPDRSGIWAAYKLPSGDVHASAWEDARSRGLLVGTCRQTDCGGYLRPGPPYGPTHARWYPAECATCGHPVAAHGPRPQPKKSRERSGQ